jgi:hypothetical protein
MKQKLYAARLLSLVQIILSLVFIVMSIWGYITYRESVAMISTSASKTLLSISAVVGRTADTLYSRQAVLKNAVQTSAASRELPIQLQRSAQVQANAPIYRGNPQHV